MPGAAAKQADSIRFLGVENDSDRVALGMIAGILQGCEYAAVGKAMAYLAARLLLHPFGVGYMDHEGEYQTIQIVLGDAPGFNGNAYLPLDQLGEAS